MQRNSTIRTLRRAGVLLTSALTFASSVSALHRPAPSSVTIDPITAEAASASRNLGGAYPLFYSKAFWLEAYYARGHKSLTLNRFEVEFDFSDPSHPTVVSGPHEVTIPLSTSYRVESVDARHGNELYVAGTARNGDALVERWTFPQQVGSYYSAKAMASPVIGVSAPVEPLLIGIGRAAGSDGSLIPPYQTPHGRTQAPPVRQELYRGAEIGRIVSFTVDPEGRFALLRTATDPALVQLVFSDPPTFNVVRTPSTLEILNAEQIGISPYHHAVEGRKYFLSGSTGDQLLPDVQLLNDADNDGVFESASPMWDTATYRANATYGAPENWTDDYTYY